DKNIEKRRKLGEYYCSLLSKIPGVRLQEINAKCLYAYPDITLLVDEKTFGLARDEMMRRLDEAGIETRKYYHPPVHRYGCYSHLKKQSSLKVTDEVADNIICLPFYPSMSIRDIEYVCRTIRRIQGGGKVKT
ncbi:MAG: DegT/DnrJ/EryC1/StrS family aminotransferase, partial [Candidatus Omnitrophica bacterium]|nr:DegT/DnrJ/EryC1/StrS family aminotransferase [Candidatus Omnitrophota bacterium]